MIFLLFITTLGFRFRTELFYKSTVTVKQQQQMAEPIKCTFTEINALAVYV
jgi:hypothetical protein